MNRLPFFFFPHSANVNQNTRPYQTGILSLTSPWSLCPTPPRSWHEEALLVRRTCTLCGRGKTNNAKIQTLKRLSFINSCSFFSSSSFTETFCEGNHCAQLHQQAFTCCWRSAWTGELLQRKMKCEEWMSKRFQIMFFSFYPCFLATICVCKRSTTIIWKLDFEIITLIIKSC